MKIHFHFDRRDWTADVSKGVSIAIPLDFEGNQPNHFGAPKATRNALQLGSFRGRTSEGGSCNVDQLHMIPHCNGTHTETIGHIVNQPVSIEATIPNRLMVSALITVESTAASETKEDYRPELHAEDRVVTRVDLENAFRSAIIEELRLEKTPAVPVEVGTEAKAQFDALILRTLPNVATKQSCDYLKTPAPFFTVPAMEWIVEQGFEHLLVDLPSIDRAQDEGRLTNHHLFWNVAEGTHVLKEAEGTEDSRVKKTITEMIFVPEKTVDGWYLLNLQIPALSTDAAPSRPVVYPMQLADHSEN